MLNFQNDPKVIVQPDLDDLLAGSWHDRMHARAIVLSYLTARTMSVVRLPTRPDRVVDGQGNGYTEAALLLDNMSDAKLLALAADLSQAYQATQAVLAPKCPNGRVTLYRAIAPLSDTGQYVAANRACDPIDQFAMLGAAAKHAKIPEIKLDFDIVSGWSQSRSNRYGSISIRREWLIEDVLLISDLTVGQGGFQRMESDEWLCVNRNPRGMLTIAWSDFEVEPLPAKYVAMLNALAPDAAAKLQAEITANPTKRTYAPRPSTNLFERVPAIPKETRWHRVKRAIRGSAQRLSRRR